MINIVNQQEKPLRLHELSLGKWYRTSNGSIVNLYKIDYVKGTEQCFCFTAFSKDNKIPLIYEYGSSCNIKFYPIEVERVEIVTK